MRTTARRILLVEDEPTTREVLTAILRGEGYEVDSVASTGAATTCLKSISYELVIADWVLPDGDGTDVADSAAQIGCKTMIITGSVSDLPTGAADRHDVFGKPVSPAVLIGAVRGAIGEPNKN
jgi:DNA-binding response OmpR family regulator